MRSRSALLAVLALAFVVAGVLLAGGLVTSGAPQPGSATVASAPSSSSAPAAPTPRTASAPAASPGASTRDRDPESGLRVVALASLPREARQTVALIDRGGPFAYAKDGATFGNRERLLPARPNGYYREYTVRTPGSTDRGARRIVTGDDDRLLYYTGDHYATFVRVRR